MVVGASRSHAGHDEQQRFVQQSAPKRAGRFVETGEEGSDALSLPGLDALQLLPTLGRRVVREMMVPARSLQERVSPTAESKLDHERNDARLPTGEGQSDQAVKCIDAIFVVESDGGRGTGRALGRLRSDSSFELTYGLEIFVEPELISGGQVAFQRLSFASHEVEDAPQRLLANAYSVSREAIGRFRKQLFESHSRVDRRRQGHPFARPGDGLGIGARGTTHVAGARFPSRPLDRLKPGFVTADVRDRLIDRDPVLQRSFEGRD